MWKCGCTTNQENCGEMCELHRHLSESKDSDQGFIILASWIGFYLNGEQICWTNGN